MPLLPFPQHGASKQTKPAGQSRLLLHGCDEQLKNALRAIQVQHFWVV